MTRTIWQALALAACVLGLHAPPVVLAAAPAITDIGEVEVMASDSGLPKDWQHRGVFVEILVRAYQDSDGDGIGDLNGVASRLDYLKDLGVRGIWLMPIFRSDDRDHGYAVVNYREIEPDYGTLADFDRLLAEAHKRGIGVIVDYVINHSSSAHPAFEDAYDHRDSRFADWYVFANTEQKGWNTFSGDPWREAKSRWYYAVFDANMPDFNLRNPEVVDFHLNNLKFWLNRGVDGFRFDAVGVLIENRAIAWENQPENHVLMKRVQDLLAQYPNRYMVCEAPGDPGAFAAGDSCGSAFAFGLQKHILGSIKLGRVRPDLLYTLRTLPVRRLGTILANHDYFAGARLFKQFNGDEKAYRLAAAALMTLPGMPFIYYGEEIGLSQSNPVSNADQSIRGPMSWNSQANAGFTTADKPFRPNVDNWKTHNVAAENDTADSLLNWYRALIALRNSETALSIGSFSPLSQKDEPIFAFTRTHENSTLFVLMNFAYRDAVLTLPEGFQPARWTPLFPTGAKPNIGAKTMIKPAKPAPKSRLPAAPRMLEIRMEPQQLLILRATP